MRNGPNPKYEPISYMYPFEGDGMIHALYFEKDRVRYHNRWIDTRELRAETRAGKALYGGFERPAQPEERYLKPGDPRSPFKNSANTNVIEHGGHILALYEGGLPHKLSADLETLGPWDYSGAIPSMTAHPRLDPITGDLHFFSYSIMAPPFLTYYVADPRGQILKTLPIDLPNPTLIHDMVLTENYVVFFDCPHRL
jgi:carotenoid cleavage dioxygenase-like enzyme